MTFKTHITTSLLVSEAFIAITYPFFKNSFNLTDILIFFIVVVFSSLFPDIDEEKSTISKIFPGSFLIHKFFKHRGFTHNIFGISLFTYLFYMFNIYIIGLNSYDSLFFSLSFFLGYSMHLFGDLVTYAGIYNFFLFDKKTWKLNILNNFKVGSLYEMRIYLITLIIQLIVFIVIFLNS